MQFEALRDLKVMARKKLDERLAGNPSVEPDGDGYRLVGDHYRKQTRVVLRNSEIINPLDIDEYIALDGYRALADLLEKKVPPADVVETMIDAHLRGRGGAVFLREENGKRRCRTTRAQVCHLQCRRRRSRSLWTVIF